MISIIAIAPPFFALKLPERHRRISGEAVLAIACGATVGAIVFRGLIAVALRVGLSPIDLKLATAAFVLATLALPNVGLWRGRTGVRP